jgi:hypothetical protein
VCVICISYLVPKTSTSDMLICYVCTLPNTWLHLASNIRLETYDLVLDLWLVHFVSIPSKAVCLSETGSLLSQIGFKQSFKQKL